MAKVPIFKNYINGKWKPSSSGDTFDNINPANTREIVGRFQESTYQDVDEAVEAAAAALPKWKSTPAPQRGEILFRVAELLLKQKESLAQDMTREMGKI
ncbi:MAG: aldehyde dehydrogenase family protein, partial [Nitrospinae bacterium]|nr:aldehyde dehydrogenase family protein [Nitrospinota bacterium]